MLGADGQPVLQDGKIVMVDAEGRIVQDEESKAKAAPAKKKFQKRRSSIRGPGRGETVEEGGEVSVGFGGRHG